MRTKGLLINKNHPITIIKLSLVPIKRARNMRLRVKKTEKKEPLKKGNGNDSEARRKSLNVDKEKIPSLAP